MKQNVILLLFLHSTSLQIISTCRFVEKYTELESNSNLTDDTLFEESSRALLADGILLKTRATPTVSHIWSKILD